MSKPFVAILMGSDSDLKTMENTIEIFKQLQVPYEVKITSAHRTPAATHEYVASAEKRGCAVFIAAAGVAAHLAGTVAGITLKPVIGVPMEGGPLNGHDALLSTVQMPGGVPVASMAIGKAGAKNAALFAAQILALSDAEIDKNVRADRARNAEQVIAKDKALQESLAK